MSASVPVAIEVARVAALGPATDDVATPATPRARPRRGAIAAAIAAAAVAGGVVIVAAGGRGGPEAATAVGAPPPSPAPARPAAGGAATAIGAAADHAAPATPAKPDGPPQITLHFRTTPSGARVKVGKRELGPAPVDLILPFAEEDKVWVEATHQLRLLKLEVHPDRDRDVILDFDAARAYDVDRAPPRLGDSVLLHVTSHPPGAVIKVDGNSYGLAPLDVRLPRGAAERWLDARYDLHLGTTRITPDRDQRVEVDVIPSCARALKQADDRVCVRRFCEAHPGDAACPVGL
jgi:hypothetical protein